MTCQLCQQAEKGSAAATAAAAQLHQACRDVGFFYVKYHGALAPLYYAAMQFSITGTKKYVTTWPTAQLLQLLRLHLCLDASCSKAPAHVT
jgi:hypothetical protein